MGPLRFRSAQPVDVDSICRLWKAAGVGSRPTTDRAEIDERLRAEDGFFVIAEVDALPVGVAMGCYDNHRGWLKRVAVDPAHRGHGIGRRLVDEVEQRFLAAGVTKLRLAVWDDNSDAVAFWTALEYVELPEIRYFSKDLLGADDDGC